VARRTECKNGSNACPDPYLTDQFAKFESGNEFDLDGKYNLGIPDKIYADNRPCLTERTKDLDSQDPDKLTLTTDDLDPVFGMWQARWQARLNTFFWDKSRDH